LRAEYLTQASGFFERALARDPGNIDALVGTALVNYLHHVTFLTDNPAAVLAAAEAALTKALSLAPEHALAHLCLGRVQIHTNRAAEGIAECERALALDPNLAQAHAGIGIGELFMGRAEKTEAHINEALRLSPRDSFVYVWLGIVGIAKFFLGKDEEAVTWLRRAIETNRNHPMAYFYLATALAHLNRMNEAQAATQAGLAVNPSFTIARHRAAAPPSDNPFFLARRERFHEGMRKAGVPEE
jgi:tetratricopeptide (TPR) repeat protein